MKTANKPDAVNPAMALRLAVEDQWRRVTDLERSPVCSCTASTSTHMRLLTSLLLAVSVAIMTSCSKSDSGASQSGSTKQESLPEAQVDDIVNATNAKDVAKVEALLQANPKLVRAKFTRGGPVGGWPLLMIAAKLGDKPMVELFLRSGADVNDKNYSGEVALHYAAYGGYKDVVQILLDHKAEVNVRNDAEATPLSIAESAGKRDVVALLKQHGAK